ncbi:unnamed protein product [Staurois parvus]|uniref:Uncharacterized protein n=1 Tax=Staurois parvus TaxID=386267 RepID=A0ABN9G154_9NEOB|nr:unnamed protein product [Staurois parvus]
MFHCSHSVLWLEFSVWGSSEKLGTLRGLLADSLASQVTLDLL